VRAWWVLWFFSGLLVLRCCFGVGCVVGGRGEGDGWFPFVALGRG
jgi:hypothetical protein